MKRSEFIKRIHLACEGIGCDRYKYSCDVIMCLIGESACYSYGEIMGNTESRFISFWLLDSYKQKLTRENKTKQHRIISMLLFKEHCLQHKLYEEF